MEREGLEAERAKTGEAMLRQLEKFPLAAKGLNGHDR
jgi:hypothetical protein